MTTLTESDVEQVALEWLANVGWQVVHGPDIAPDTPGAQRTDYGEVVLSQRLRDGLGPVEPAPAFRIQRAVQDKATVPIYYESRLAKLALDEKEKPSIDPRFEEATKSGGTGKTALDQSEAVAGMLEKCEV